MIKYLLVSITVLLFSACGGSGGSTSSSDLATVPHSKSSIPMLAILVNYNNVSIVSSDTTWSNKLFGKREHELNHYYQEVSNLNFEFAKATENSAGINDGVISVNLNKNHPNKDIDADFTAFSDAVYPDLKDVLVKTNSFIDFSNYDENGDGHITSDELILIFIIAGYEDAWEGGHVTNGIWAHENCLEAKYNPPILDGVSLMGCQNSGNFALFGEKHNTQNPHDATIGIIAHELGHAVFNLPDLYNTSYLDSGGIGYFGLMDSGTWGMQSDDIYDGNTPVHFTAWSKIYNGWITPTLGSGYHSMYATSSSDYNVVKIPIDATSYYLLENRDNSGYDRGLYRLSGRFDGGIALWKIDTSKLTAAHFNTNSVNADTANKGVDLVEASYSTIDSSGGTGDEDALYYNPNRTSFGTLITNISQRGSLMSLNVN